jgi:hypothetical protein
VAVLGSFALSAQTTDPPQGGNSGATIHLDKQGGLISVSARDAQIQALIDDLARQAEIDLISETRLKGRVSVDIQAQPLEEVLAKILRNHSFALEQTGPATATGGSNSETRGRLWIFSASGKRPAAKQPPGPTPVLDEPAEPSERDQLDQLTALLLSDDSDDRLEAVLGLARHGGFEASAALTAALSDVDLEVRMEAVMALAEIGDESAAIALQTALADTDPNVRLAAIEALADIGGDSARPALEQALGDPDEDIREAAREILESRDVPPEPAAND